MDLKRWLPFQFQREEEGKQTADAPESPKQPNFQRMIETVFRDLWNMGEGQSFLKPRTSERFFGDFSPEAFHPVADLVDEGESLRLSAELPGMDANDIEISIHEGVLTLTGEKRLEKTSKDEGFYRAERAYGRFQRTFPLPAGLNLDHIEATFAKGILTVRLPKAEVTRSEPRRIDIKK